MSAEKHEHCCQARRFAALYLLPYGCHPSADGSCVLDENGCKLSDPAALTADMTIGVCALQPLETIARFENGTFGYAHAHEVRVTSEDSQSVEFHFDDEYEWSGVEGRRLTAAPVRVTASWVEDESVSASARITVSSLREIVWLPEKWRISADGRELQKADCPAGTAVPHRADLEVGKTLKLAAVGKYEDGIYRSLSRSELEFACVDDWIEVVYDADTDEYRAKALRLPDSSGEAAEIMLAAMANDDLFAAFFVYVK